MPDFEVPDDIVPYAALQRRDQHNGESARWITRKLYTEIQCLVLQRKLQAKVDAALAKGTTAPKAEERLRILLMATTQHELEQWLQNSSGRAILSCNSCGRIDVERVLELWSDGARRRVCPECLVARGWNLNEIIVHTNAPNILMLMGATKKVDE